MHQSDLSPELIHQLRQLRSLARDHGLDLAVDWIGAQALTDDHFREYLNRASTEVATWPERKRHLLGRLPER